MPRPSTGWESVEVYGDPKSQITKLPIFSPESPLDQLFSDYIIIESGKAVMFQAHNMREDRFIYTNLVLAVNGITSQRPSCVPKELFGNAIDLYIQRVTLGGAENWILTSENPQMVISLPGVYRFELSDLDMLGNDLYVDSHSWELKDRSVPFPVVR